MSFKIRILIFFLFIISVDNFTQSSIDLTFGLYQSDKATVMYRMFIPILEALHTSMEDSLGESVDIQLRIFKSYEDANIALTGGEVDFVRFGPASYVIAKKTNPAIKLIVMENNKGHKTFNGVIAVKDSSPYKSLKDLKGTRFAFGSSKSTIGRYLAQAELVKAGLISIDFEKYAYLDRHDRVFKAVELGDYDAGAIKESTYKRNNKDGVLRVIFTFPNVTKPWIARENLPENVYNAIKKALLNLTDPLTLSELGINGFFSTDDKEYEYVRESMEIVSKFSDDEL